MMTTPIHQATLRSVLKKTLFSAILCAVSIVPHLARADASKIYLSPENGVYSVGSVFPVEVLLDSDGRMINAAEAEIVFDPEELGVKEINTDGSSFGLWPIEPSFSNEGGTIEFAAATREPFIADGSPVLTVLFEAKRSNVTEARLAAGAILAADGKGTNILSALQSGVYTFEPQELLVRPTYVQAAETPNSAIISSPTHSEPDKWYAADTALFNWKVPPGTEATRLLLDGRPRSVPTVYYAFPLSTQTVEGIEDGVWYFHVQLRTGSGWGAIEHFKVQVDTTPPDELKIMRKDETDTTNPRPAFSISAHDALSGIEVYEIQIDDNTPVFWRGELEVYEAPVLAYGAYTIFVKAIDRAGNHHSDSREFTVDPITAPTLLSYPSALGAGESIEIKGTSTPGSVVTIWLEHESEEPLSHKLIADEYGSFTTTLPPAPGYGAHYLWAEAHDERGAKSAPSEVVSVVYDHPGLASFLSPAGSLFLLFAIFLLAAGGLGGYLLYRLKAYTSREHGQP